MTLTTRRVELALATTVLLAPTSAWAYLDPGTGSILLQGLIAAIAGVAVAGRLYWTRIKAFFRKSDRTEPPDRDSEHSD